MTNKEKEYFRTPVSEPKQITTPSGKKEEEVIAMRLDENGKEEFYVAGKTNVYEKTQADLEDSKIGVILRRVTETGDITLLNQRQGKYADITAMPTNRIEAFNLVRKNEESFAKLPEEIRKKYDNNLDKYLEDFGSENWFKNMGINMNPKGSTPEKTEPEKGEN